MHRNETESLETKKKKIIILSSQSIFLKYLEEIHLTTRKNFFFPFCLTNRDFSFVYIFYIHLQQPSPLRPTKYYALEKRNLSTVCSNVTRAGSDESSHGSVARDSTLCNRTCFERSGKRIVG